MNDEDAYSQVAAELAANNLKVGLMTKAIADSVGNENVAKSLYIKFRAQQILEEYKTANKIKQQQDQLAKKVATKQRTAFAMRKIFLVVCMIACLLLTLFCGLLVAVDLSMASDKSVGMNWAALIIGLLFTVFFGVATTVCGRGLNKNKH